MELEGLDQKQISTYQTVITENNINGKVLATCDLNELGHIMGMTFGDWQLFRAWILAARNPAQECTAWYVNKFACDFSLCFRFFKNEDIAWIDAVEKSTNKIVKTENLGTDYNRAQVP